MQTIEESAQYTFVVNKATYKEDKVIIDGSIERISVNIVLSSPYTVRPGERYVTSGDLIPLTDNTIPNTFNYRKYLMSKKTKYILYTNDIDYSSDGFSVNIISYKINDYIEKKIPLSKSYIKTFILADKSDFDQSTIKSINTLGISHLFAVSGLHVGLLIIGSMFLLKKIGIKERNIEYFICLLLVGYMVVTSFAASITRASLMYILLVVNERFKLGLSSIDVLSLIFIVLLINNPYIYYNVGFILSFLVTLSILMSKKILYNHTFINQMMIVSMVSFFITLPLIINLNKQLNLCTVVFNIMFILYMSYIILPLSYITFIFSSTDRLLYVFIKMYNIIIETLASYKYFIIKGYIISKVEFIIIYYMIISLLIQLDSKKSIKKGIAIFIILVTLFLNSNKFDLYQRVVFLDVIGDATLITDSFDKCNILIDTGETDDYDSVITYIKSRNIKRIDYIIISHFHSDHYGELQDVINEFEIKNVITTDNVDLFSNEMRKCGNLSFYIYKMSNEDDNPNNNSIFMSVFLAQKHYLFTGDSEEEREKEFVDKYQIDIDYLKVAHHGSRTSSSELFLKSVTPTEAFIIVKRNNIHKHPNDTVIERFNKYNILVFRTDILGTIEVKYLFGNETKKYYMP